MDAASRAGRNVRDLHGLAVTMSLRLRVGPMFHVITDRARRMDRREGCVCMGAKNEITGVIQRKGNAVDQFGRLEGAPAYAAYFVEIRTADGKVRIVYFETTRSRDFYQLPVGQQVLLRVRPDAVRVGWWLDTWEVIAR